MMVEHRCKMLKVDPEKDIVLVARINEFLEGLKHKAEDFCGEKKKHRKEMMALYPEAFGRTDEESEKLGLEPGYKILAEKMTSEQKRVINRLKFEMEQAQDRFWFELHDCYPFLSELNRSIYLKAGDQGGYSVCKYNDKDWIGPINRLLELLEIKVPEGEDPYKYMPKIMLTAPKKETQKEFYDILHELKKLALAQREYMDQDDPEDDED